ncbi:hypothetical protein GQR36_03680 [Enterococcus termitis]
MADRYKQQLSEKIDYLLDIHDEDEPKLIAYPDYLKGLEEVVNQPFSLVPFLIPVFGVEHGCSSNLVLEKMNRI